MNVDCDLVLLLRRLIDVVMMWLMCVVVNEFVCGMMVGKNVWYEVMKLINCGGMVLVYEGVDWEMGEKVVLKCLDVGDGARVKVSLAAVKREIKYVMKLMVLMS